jgi:N-acetylmuramoyl-L-alanine amidase
VPLLLALTPIGASAASTTPSGAPVYSAAAPTQPAAAAAAPLAATWVPASPSNYTVADRPHDYPVDMIVIHDIEGTAASAIKMFQDPTRAASAHYIVSYHGQVTQMVAEKDIAWHAGNWDYNTRAIGIEHEGFAYTSGLYTIPEYRSSAELIASICSRWGVPMDRTHVIGHYQVPDPNHPGLFGGSDHHTDPGPYWNWTYYMSLAQYYSKLLPSPPHMVLNATAYSGDGTATVTWQPARTCRTPIDGYTVVAEPGGLQVPVSGTATSASFSGLTNGVSYTFTVTAHNPDGQDSLTSNAVTPGPLCAGAGLTAGPSSPQPAGSAIRFTATSTTCSNPQYEFAVQDSHGNWVVQQPFGASSWSWDSYTYAAGSHNIRVYANHPTGNPNQPESFAELTYVLSPFSITDWHATYDTSSVPTSWVAGRSQTFPVTVTNAGDVTWPSTGFGKVDLDVHFATVAGGSAKEASWLNSKAFSLPADLAPGAGVTVSVTWAPTSTTGSLVLEAEMIKEHEFWFPQWQPVAVNVAAPDKTAGYDMSNVPTTWVSGWTQTFPITVTNTSTATWLSTGYNSTDLDLHFATSAGGAAKQSTWLTSNAFRLPAEVAPGHSATVTVTLTAPARSGALVLEAEMIKEHEFWFQQWAPVSVTVAAPVWSASYDLTGLPLAWTKGQSQSVTLTVTNTGNQSWPSAGADKVDLDFHFTTQAGGSAQLAHWLTSKAYGLAADVAPGHSVTLTVTVVAPSTAGSMFLEAEMIKEHEFWFTQAGSVAVSVS